MEQYQTDTNNQNQILISSNLLVKLIWPHIYYIQQVIINDLHRKVVISKRPKRDFGGIGDDYVGDVWIQVVEEALDTVL